MMRILAFVLFVTLPACFAQSTVPLADTSRIASSSLRSDAALLRRALDELHPGLLRYNTPATLDSAYRVLEGSFTEDRTIVAAFLAFSEFAAVIRCGHTYVSPYNQSRSVEEALFNGPSVPFHFRWIGSRMIVTRSFDAAHVLRPGTEIRTLNGVPVSAILSRLMAVARADGSNDAKRIANLQVDGSSRYEAFDIYWPLYFPRTSDTIAAEILWPHDDAARSVSLPLISRKERSAAQTPSPAGTSDSGAGFWSLQYTKNGAALLRMQNWAVYNTSWDWQGDLRRTFADMVKRNASALIIDLRGNEGGSDVGDVIVSHLIGSSVPRQLVRRKVRYRKVPDDLVPYLDTWDPSFRDWGSAAQEFEGRFYRLRRDADDDLGGTIAPIAPRFTRRVYVIVDASNSSATFEFAQTVRQNHLGTIVGEPTGGNQRGINGGCFFFFRMPGSGLEIDLPLIGQFPDGDRPDGGLLPDITVETTVEDIASGRDGAMERVLSLIDRNWH